MKKATSQIFIVIKCINNEWLTDKLTVGQFYQVLDCYDDVFLVIDDAGNNETYKVERFEEYEKVMKECFPDCDYLRTIKTRVTSNLDVIKRKYPEADINDWESTPINGRFWLGIADMMFNAQIELLQALHEEVGNNDHVRSIISNMEAEVRKINQK